MALSSAEVAALKWLETEGGSELHNFRNRKRNWMTRRQFDEVSAIKKALEPIMASSNIHYIKTDSEQKDIEIEQTNFFSKVISFGVEIKIACFIVLLAITTGYQIFAQKGLYAEGVEGWFLAGLLELILVVVAVSVVAGFWRNLIKWGVIFALVSHIFLTLETSAIISTSPVDDGYNELRKERDSQYSLMNALPQNYIQDRKNALAIINDLNQRIPALQHVAGQVASTQHVAQQTQHAETFEKIWGREVSDVRARIRWINLMAQLYLAHALGGMLVSFLHTRKMAVQS